MSRIVPAGPSVALPLVILIGLASGCGGGGANQPAEEIFHNASLSEVGGLFEAHIADSRKPPMGLADVAKYEPGLPTGYLELKAGNIVVTWGASLAPEATDKVLAYEKVTPVSGGYVLMQDGKTIRKMTPDEFKAAPKAGKN